MSIDVMVCPGGFDVNKRKGSPNPSVQTKTAVSERDGGLCLYRLAGCSGIMQTTDHRSGRGAGGSRILNHGANLTGICVSCNGRKEDATGDVREDLIRRGLLVLKAATNEATLTRSTQTPVQYPDGSWWLLVDASTRVPWKET